MSKRALRTARKRTYKYTFQSHISSGKPCLAYSTDQPLSHRVGIRYGPSEVTAKVADGSEVTISEDTEYPFDGKILFHIKLSKPAEFPLKLRIPGWAKQGTVRYGNESWTPPGGQVIAVWRAWKNGDVVSLELPMEIRIERRYNNDASILRGPLYFALRVGQQYKGGGMPRNLEITAATPWNYGLVFPNGESIGDTKALCINNCFIVRLGRSCSSSPRGRRGERG